MATTEDYLNLINESPASSIAGGPTLRRGSSGQAVRDLQSALARLGHRLTIDGIFGSATELAVKSFQSSMGLPANGIVDKVVWDALVEKTGGVPQLVQPQGSTSPASAATSLLARVFGDRPVWQTALMLAGGVVLLAVAAKALFGRSSQTAGFARYLADVTPVKSKGCGRSPSADMLEDAETVE